jgi:hypothetical protein
MTEEIEWEDLPTSRRNSVQKWDEIATTLRSKPGEWAKVAVNVPEATRGNIMAGRIHAFHPVEDFEARNRKPVGYAHNRTDLYMRYVGA